MPAAAPAQVAWGDADNGDLDLLLAPIGVGANEYSMRVYRNLGRAKFVDSGTDLLGVFGSSAAWGDVDNDGDLDIVLAGWDSALAFHGKIYLNNGSGQFEDSGANILGAAGGSLDLGNSDNDGDLDILITGHRNPTAFAKVYHNEGGGQFEDSGAVFPGVGYGRAAWGDSDNDGDLDVLIAVHEGIRLATRIYRNNNDTANTMPTTPAGLQATVAGTSATLTWDGSTDGETSSSGLTYNLRVGTTNGGVEVAPAHALSFGRRLLPKMGSTNHGRTRTLNGLRPGQTYHWSAQAIDNTWAASPFAAEGTFTVPLPTVRFSRSATTVNEGGAATLIATLSFPSPEEVTVQYVTIGRSASAGQDFTAAAGVLKFAPGVTRQSFKVQVAQDSLDEVDELITLKLRNPVHAMLGAGQTASLTMRDDDAAPVLTIVDAKVIEGNAGATNAVFLLRLSAPSGKPVSVRYATASSSAMPGSDFTVRSGTLGFPPRATQQTIVVPVIGDRIDERNERFLINLIRLTNVTLGDVQALGNVVDDD